MHQPIVIILSSPAKNCPEQLWLYGRQRPGKLEAAVPPCLCPSLTPPLQSATCSETSETLPASKAGKVPRSQLPKLPVWRWYPGWIMSLYLRSLKIRTSLGDKTTSMPLPFISFLFCRTIPQGLRLCGRRFSSLSPVFALTGAMQGTSSVAAVNICTLEKWEDVGLFSLLKAEFILLLFGETVCLKAQWCSLLLVILPKR